MIRDGTENDLSSRIGSPFRRSLLSTENNLRKDESEVKIPLKKETVKKEKIMIEGEIIS